MGMYLTEEELSNHFTIDQIMEALFQTLRRDMEMSGPDGEKIINLFEERLYSQPKRNLCELVEDVKQENKTYQWNHEGELESPKLTDRE